MFDVDKSKQRIENLGEAGSRLYRQNCMGCHGPDKKGVLIIIIDDIGKRYDPKSFCGVYQYRQKNDALRLNI